MLEAARGWLTPPVLFVLVNLVIATIAVASRLMTPAAPGGADEAGGGGGGGRRAAALLRAPSLAVDRLRASFSFSRLAADHAALFDYPAPAAEPAHQPQETTAGVGAGAAGNDAEEEVALEHRREEEEEEEARIERSRSEAAAELAPSSARRPRARKTRRAAATAAAAEEPAVAPRHAAAVRREEPAAAAAEVDARADDFIQRFREQLRMQRLDSILRYRDTLRRTGTA